MRDVQILNYLPKIIAATREFQHLADVENFMLNKLWHSHKMVIDNQFINSLTEYGCMRWEKILGISPMDTDTLDDRRFKILAHINSDIPYTYRQLQNILTNLCGDDGYKLNLLSDEYKIIVRVALTAKKQFNTVQQILNQVVPANMVIDCSLLHNQYKNLLGKTHSQLIGFTHNNLRNEAL